jgi:hypothetical protein
VAGAGVVDAEAAAEVVVEGSAEGRMAGVEVVREGEEA